MDYRLHDGLVHATSWQSKQAMFVRRSFLLACDRREPSGGLSPSRIERKADDLLLDAVPSALRSSLWRTKRQHDARSRENPVTREFVLLQGLFTCAQAQRRPCFHLAWVCK